ncbi:MAG TPA: hypothetical protein PLZ57_09320 [Pseudobdellovibrionaceae bacterium]|nr:hypothetical protein [Pseudobdellovibrionaceae bacterium]
MKLTPWFFAGIVALGLTQLGFVEAVLAATPDRADRSERMERADRADRVDRERKRLEELFIWKMSEELKLSVDTEVTFAEALRGLNREKSVALTELNEALMALGEATRREKTAGVASLSQAMSRYEKAVRRYGEVPVREVARLKPILGAEVLARYLFAKSQVTEKLLAISTSGATAPDHQVDSATGAAKPSEGVSDSKMKPRSKK